MKISIIGSGYVGLVSGAGLAEAGHNVLCMDLNADRIANLRQGKITNIRARSRRNAGR